MAVVQGENILHHVKKEGELSGLRDEEMSGGICLGEYVQGEMSGSCRASSADL